MNLMILSFLGIATVGAVFSFFYLLVKPFLGKRPVGYIPVPYMRPAHSFIIDRSLHRYGVGEVIGSERLARDKANLKIRSSSGILNAIYYDYELEPTNIFDSVCGDGNQTFMVKEGIYTNVMDAETVKYLKGELTNLKSKNDLLDRENSQIRNNIGNTVDDYINRFLDFEKSKRPSKKTGLVEE